MAPSSNIFNVDADLTTLGKIIGGGLPVAAYGGRAEIMNTSLRWAPFIKPARWQGIRSPWPQASPHSNNSPPKVFIIASPNKAIASPPACASALADAKLPGQVNNSGSLSTLFFADHAVRDYAGAKRSNTQRYARFFREMLDRGVFLAPSQFEAAFVSAVHTPPNIDYTIAAAADSLKAVANDA